MQTWIHNIGKGYYKTPGAFAREANAFGVTRRVDLRIAEKMEWGDRVVLCTQSGKSKVIFGEFMISKLSGLSPEAMAALQKMGVNWLTFSNTPRKISRGCGTYYVTAAYTIESSRLPLPKIAKVLADLKEQGKDIGKPMVGGVFAEWDNHVRMKDLSQNQGFRLFDYHGFRNDQHRLMVQGGAKWLRGHYYVTAEQRSDIQFSEAPVWGSAYIEQVEDYQRK